MPIRTFRPYTPGVRQASVADFAEITRSEPEKSLTSYKHRRKGRNNLGRITCRHRGGGHKRLYRKIDFKRDKLGMTAEVLSIEYDPNRNARISLVQYEDGEKRYIITPVGLRVPIPRSKWVMRCPWPTCPWVRPSTTLSWWRVAVRKWPVLRVPVLKWSPKKATTSP
jgi:hypothetical protein